MEEKDALFEQRLKKLSELREQGINPYPNDFRVKNTTGEIREKFKDSTPEDLKKVEDVFSLLAGLWLSGASARPPSSTSRTGRGGSRPTSERTP